ncbi:MAG: Na+-transporting NADH:ubiquinone oxidoreductase subunit G, partial [Candidatus Sumerlaeota bacterium]
MAKHKEFSSFQMVLTLVVVCGGAAMALAFVNELTKEPIHKARLNAKLEAIRAVLPEFTNNPYGEAIAITFREHEREIYPAYKDDKLVGVAVPASSDSG